MRCSAHQCQAPAASCERAARRRTTLRDRMGYGMNRKPIEFQKGRSDAVHG